MKIGYKDNQDLGEILENAVYNHLLYKEWEVKVGIFERNEIDFFCQKDGETMNIQVAMRLDEQKTIEREFGNLLTINDNYPKYVITNNQFSGNSYQGIQLINIRDFLTS